MRVVLLVVVAAIVVGGVRAADRPNVVLLVTDDQRGDAVGALGNPHIITPNMDRLVLEGFVFRNAYCMGSMQPAVCMPSRTMLHSGRSLYRLVGDTAQAARVESLLALLADQQREWGDTQPLRVPNPKPAAVDVETFFSKP